MVSTGGGFMKLTEHGFIPDQNDSGLYSKSVNLKGIVYKHKEEFYVITFDVLGEVINEVIVTQENLSFIKIEEFTDNMLAFVDVIFYDIFMIVEPIVFTKLQEPAREHFKKSRKKTEEFDKKMFNKFLLMSDKHLLN